MQGYFAEKQAFFGLMGRAAGALGGAARSAGTAAKSWFKGAKPPPAPVAPALPKVFLGGPTPPPAPAAPPKTPWLTPGKVMTGAGLTMMGQNMLNSAATARGMHDHQTGYMDGMAEGMARAGHLVDTLPMAAKLMMMLKGTPMLESDSGKKYITDWLSKQSPTIQEYAPAVMDRVTNRLVQLRQGKTDLPFHGMFSPSREVDRLGQDLATRQAQLQYLQNVALPQMIRQVPAA